MGAILRCGGVSCPGEDGGVRLYLADDHACSAFTWRIAASRGRHADPPRPADADRHGIRQIEPDDRRVNRPDLLGEPHVGELDVRHLPLYTTRRRRVGPFDTPKTIMEVGDG
jgi:hypothetical protein